MPADLPPPFVCQVVKVHDADGPLWCENGLKVRVAGVQAPDWQNAAPCRQRKPGYVCDDAKARASKRIAERLVLGRGINCRPADRSWKRIVARCTLPDGRSLTCALIAAGAATRWDSYWRRYKMGECR
ncbi:thermonuclease family protein [Sphingomonas sp. IC4-52]|uniref:thermonuclease family protein n=1 Tax=Sphingomonas sp. IC4-52 TaxID=2887202 RepID=UPI001D11BA50|nr:hypothetical protein [Sphingomonas sp. IC4-52]MCC2978825.1 hypothetical protein [Sphingomonas sp. IC4-52]